MFRHPLFQYSFPIYRFCHPVLPSFKQYTCSANPFFNIFSYIQVLPSCFTILKTLYMFRRPLFQYFFLIYRFCHPVLPSLKYYTCSAAPFFNIFFLYTGSAILFYHLLNSNTCSATPFFNIFSYIQVLPSCFTIFKQYSCSAAPLFNIFSYIQVLPSCFTFFKQYTCSATPFFQYFFLYTGSAILFYHLLNSIHVPLPPFSIFFSYIQVLPSCFTIF